MYYMVCMLVQPICMVNSVEMVAYILEAIPAVLVFVVQVMVVVSMLVLPTYMVCSIVVVVV